MARILILAPIVVSLRNFRGALIEELLARGHEVHAVAPDMADDPDTRAWLLARGVKCHEIPMERAGMNPLSELRFLWAATRLMRTLRVEVFLGYTVKPVVWGLIAAWLAGVPGRIGLITGLGYAFTGELRGKRALVQRAARGLYSAALRRATLVFFQNPDDRDDFRHFGLLPRTLRVEVVNGSGVDTEAFAPAPLPDGPLRFLLIARLLGDKGIREYAAAAAQVRARWPDVECHLVGGLDSNPDAIAEAEVRDWHDAGVLNWHGPLADVRPAIAAAHVYVLPSYREGTPRSVLEAMAMGRPIITTDAPGCRETVREGVNGFLVPPRDTAALVEAMSRMVQDSAMLAEMGARSRSIAVERYDVHAVNAAMLAAMAL